MSDRKLFVGNWKMHKTDQEAIAFLKELQSLVGTSEHDVWIAPPFTAIYPMAQMATAFQIGAQNIHEENEGAFTGEISGLMVKDAGAKFVILGHSERRALYQESDELVNKKIKKALEIGLIPILCVGETLDEREAGDFKDVLEAMLEKSLEGIDEASMKKIIISYEPVWAIGTGIVATPEMAEEVHSFIREWIQKKYTLQTAAKAKILYGGSVKPENIQVLLQLEDIDGVLVGGASLSPHSFASIILTK